MNMLEKRRSLRIARQYILECHELQIPVKSVDKYTGFTKDVSCHGISFEIDKEFLKGVLLKISLNLHGWTKYKTEFLKPYQLSKDTPLVLLGNVVRIKRNDNNKKGYYISVDFTNIDRSDQQAFARYIKEQSITVH